MSSSVLEATRDIVLAYIQKYPTSTSAYSANVEAAMGKLREEIVAFAKQVYIELADLEIQHSVGSAGTES